MGSMFLIVVDAYSKWLEVNGNNHGRENSGSFAGCSLWIPKVVVSDNGPQFTAQKFAEFMEGNGINHLRGAPYHPQTNGFRFVQTFKQSLQKGERGWRNNETEIRLLSTSLLHSTPHNNRSTTSRALNEETTADQVGFIATHCAAAGEEKPTEKL